MMLPRRLSKPSEVRGIREPPTRLPARSAKEEEDRLMEQLSSAEAPQASARRVARGRGPPSTAG